MLMIICGRMKVKSPKSPITTDKELTGQDLSILEKWTLASPQVKMLPWYKLQIIAKTIVNQRLYIEQGNLMTMHDALHPRDEIDSCMQQENKTRRIYQQGQRETDYSSNRNENRKIIKSTKQKSEEKQLNGYFKQQT